MCKTYREATAEIDDALQRIQHHWLTIEMELSVLKNLSRHLDEGLQSHLTELIQMLQLKLQDAVCMVDSVTGTTPRESPSLESLSSRVSIGSIGEPLRKSKFRYATRVKKSLCKLLADFEHWQKQLQPAWYLLVLMQNSAIDEQLHALKNSGNDQILKLRRLRDVHNLRADPQQGGIGGSIFMSDSDVRSLTGRTRIMYTRGESAVHSGSGESLYIETFTPDPSMDHDLATRNVRDLGRVLSAVDPMVFCIFACVGIIKVTSISLPSQFQFVFRVPDTLYFPPKTLRETLLTHQRYPLDQAIGFAKQLASSVMFVHTTNFVHKAIRPDSILLLHQKPDMMHFAPDEDNLGTPFLVGFDKFRPAGGTTYLHSDSEWEKDLYRHPTRQGTCPEEYYSMQHDIYSLGVCLLEIGLWNSFVIPNHLTSSTYLPSPALGIPPEIWSDHREKRRAKAIKTHLVDMARKTLPLLMGSRFARVVVMCLCCLDRDGSNEFGDEQEFVDQDGIQVGVRFIEKVPHSPPPSLSSLLLLFCVLSRQLITYNKKFFANRFC